MKTTFLTRRRRSSYGLAGIALVLLGIAGCGGGGGSSSPSPPTTGGGGRCSNGVTYTPNYVASVDLLRWEAFPLRIFFIRDAQHTAERQARTIRGFDRWVVATRNATSGNGANYTVVSQQAQADISVKFFVFTGGSGDTLGTTTVQYTPSDNVIQSADMELGVTGDADTDIATAAHEYGHALGIAGHSPSTRDLMHPFGNDSGAVTTSDLNTVLTAYCGEFKPNTNAIRRRSTEPTRTIVLH